MMKSIVDTDHRFLQWVNRQESFFNMVGAGVFIAGYVLAIITAPAALVQALRGGMHLARPGQQGGNN
jgi:hypothetical protein